MKLDANLPVISFHNNIKWPGSDAPVEEGCRYLDTLLAKNTHHHKSFNKRAMAL